MPRLNDRVYGTSMLGSKIAIELPVVAESGYDGRSGIPVGGPRRLLSLNSTGHVSPAFTSKNVLPLLLLRFVLMLRPGFPLYVPVNAPSLGLLNPTENPPRIVACSGSPRIARSRPLRAIGRHATPTFGATLFQS